MYPDIELSLDVDPHAFGHETTSELAAPRSEQARNAPQRASTQAHLGREANAEQILARLRESRPFAGVPVELLAELSTRTGVVSAPPGLHTLTAGHALFLVVEGRTQVSGEIPGPRALAVGDTFGERSLVARTPYPLELSVTEPLVALELPAVQLRALGARLPDMRELISQLLARPLLVKLFKSSPLFAKLDTNTRRHMVRSFELKELPAGTILVSPNEPCRGLSLAVTPSLEVVTRDGQTGTLPPGSSVGQSALVSRDPLDYWARTAEDGVVLHLSCARFARVIEACAQASHRSSKS